MKETDWIPGELKPVRVGVYKRRIHGERFYSWWDGDWSVMCSQKNIAKKNKDMRSSFQDLPWKGLAK